MAKCEQCGADVIPGTGVDHELTKDEVIEFCSMDHFKAWIDARVELIKWAP